MSLLLSSTRHHTTGKEMRPKVFQGARYADQCPCRERHRDQSSPPGTSRRLLPQPVRSDLRNTSHTLHHLGLYLQIQLDMRHKKFAFLRRQLSGREGTTRTLSRGLGLAGHGRRYLERS